MDTIKVKTINIFLASLFFFLFLFVFSSKNAYAYVSCYCPSMWGCVSADNCDNCNYCGAWEGNESEGTWWFLKESCSGGFCSTIHCSASSYEEAIDYCESGGSSTFDESSPKCLDEPSLSFYSYARSVTNLIANPSFEERGPLEPKNRIDNEACTDKKCSERSGTTVNTYDPLYWRTDYENDNNDPGVNNQGLYGNDGPTNPDNCDPVEAQCFNDSGAIHGSWYLGIRDSTVDVWVDDQHCCFYKKDRHDWIVNQLVTGLIPGSRYLFLFRSRGKAKEYDGNDTSGYTQARIRTVSSGRVETGTFLGFKINRKDNNAADATIFNVNVKFYPDDGSPVQTYNYPNGFSQNQGGNNWYYLACKSNRDVVGTNNCVQLTYQYDSVMKSNLWMVKDDPYGFLRINGAWFHPGSIDNRGDATIVWRAPQAGRVEFSGSLADADSAGGDGVKLEIYKDTGKLKEVEINNGGSASFNSENLYEGWLTYKGIDSGWVGGEADDYWRGDSYEFTADSDKMEIILKSMRDDSEGWAPNGAADWLELIEICDENGYCRHGTPDGKVFNVNVNNNTRSMMQLKNIFNDGSESDWGMISDSNGRIIDSGWAPFSRLFFWRDGGAKEIAIRFWNQRDLEQKVVECEGTSGTSIPAPTCAVSYGSPWARAGEATEYCVSTTNAPQGSELWYAPVDEDFPSHSSWTSIRSKTIADGCGRATFPQAGEYYVHCNAYNNAASPVACTGNPGCPWETDLYPDFTCEGWSNCGSDDYLRVTVTNPLAWWQVKTGDVYGKAGISSPVGFNADPAYFSLVGSFGPNSGLVASLSTANNDFSGDSGVAGKGENQATQTDFPFSHHQALEADFTPLLDNYSYAKLSSLVDLAIKDDKQESYNSGVKVIKSDKINKTDLVGASAGLYYYPPYGTGDMAISLDSSFSVGANEKLIIFVEDDLHINQNISVTPGGFLALVVKGKINVANNVTQIQGVYFTDNVFTVESNGATDSQFNGQGIFVGKEGISLKRDFRSAANASTPAEIFTFDPAYLFTAPRVLREKPYLWQEVIP